MFPSGLCLLPAPASSPWSLGDNGPHAQPLADLHDRPVVWCELTGAEFSLRNGCFGNNQEPAGEMRCQCCFCPLSREFVLQVLMQVHITYVALGHSFQLCKPWQCWYQVFPLADTVRAEGTDGTPCPCPAPGGLPHPGHSPRGLSVPVLRHQAQPCPVGPPMGRHPSLLLSPGRCPMPSAGAEMDLDCWTPCKPPAAAHGEPQGVLAGAPSPALCHCPPWASSVSAHCPASQRKGKWRWPFPLLTNSSATRDQHGDYRDRHFHQLTFFFFLL